MYRNDHDKSLKHNMDYGVSILSFYATVMARLSYEPPLRYQYTLCKFLNILKEENNSNYKNLIKVIQLTNGKITQKRFIEILMGKTR